MATDMVRRNEEAGQQLSTLMTPGRAAAAQWLQARILLTADVRAGGRGGTDAESAEAWDPRASTGPRGRHACVEQGGEAAVSRQRPTGRPYRTLEGAQEARRIA